MRILRFGTARPTVVLLHSSASSARQWDALIRVLEPRFRVFAVDLHGHGARGGWTSDRPLALGDEAALVEPLLDASGGVHLVGHSYGAAVALKAATLYRRRVRSVVAYEPVLFPMLIEHGCTGQAQIVATLAETVHTLVRRDRHAEAAQRFIDYWSGATTWDAMPAERQHAIAERMPAVARHFDALFGEPSLAAHASRLALPMLFLGGSATVPAMQQTMALLRDAVPRARHETLDGAGHMGPILNAADVNACIAGFLDRRVPAASSASANDEAVPAVHRAGVSPGPALAASR